MCGIAKHLVTGALEIPLLFKFDEKMYMPKVKTFTRFYELKYFFLQRKFI